MTSKNKKQLYKIILGGGVFFLSILASYIYVPAQTILQIIAYIILGEDVITRALGNIKRGRLFDENFLMAIATIGAFAIGEHPEAVMVMFFYQVGELFQSYAVNKSRASISELMDIRPDYANLLDDDGNATRVEPDEIEEGQTIVIYAGERVPLDCVVINGSSTLDTAALTGESLPRDVSEGSTLLSGFININGLLTARVTKEYYDSTASKILDLVENAAMYKSKPENFITKFAKYYTPAVVISAALLAFIPPIFLGFSTFTDWFYRALTFLVISCPCALVISIPLTFFGGIGACSKNGLLVKGSNYLEALSKVDTIVFDKTGTLTKGTFHVQEITPVGLSADALLELTAYAEYHSSHPIAQSLVAAFGKPIDKSVITTHQEIIGCGLIATIGDSTIAVGNSKLLAQQGVVGIDTSDKIGSVVHVTRDNIYCGYIVVADEIKLDAVATIEKLKHNYKMTTMMLTGDVDLIGQKIGKDLGIDKVHTQLLPSDKLEIVQALKKDSSHTIAFVGDGINDAPVLASSDLGIAMGGLGSDAAIEAADLVLMTDEPAKICTAIDISKKTLTIVYQNIFFALGIKFFVLILGAIGFASMWAAIFADVGVMVLAILNAIRVLYTNFNKN
ncbi:MAG: heavy metal translocating P-type ATPase [Lachnospiraceae bacterium]